MKLFKKITKHIKIDSYIMVLMITLCIGYISGMIATGWIKSLNKFDSYLVMDTAQIARNTIRGELFITKYILPVSYSFFPTIKNHPDFIRYPFQIILYSILFLLFSPTPIVIKLFNCILLLINGYLIYKIVLRIQQKEKDVEGIRENQIQRIIALFSAISASLLFTSYLQMALSDNYEVITYCLQLIIIFMVLNRETKPFILGILCGLLYLSRPNFSIFAAVFILYYFLPKFTSKKWILSGLFCALGIFIIIIPFVIRSYLLTGEPLFALQHKIDAIKGIVSTHDDLYMKFSNPPDVIRTILENITIYLMRWERRVLIAIKTLFSKEILLFLVGIPFFLKNFSKSRKILGFYLLFILIHMVVVANYLADSDTGRVYISILSFVAVIGSIGLFELILKNIVRFQNRRIQNYLIVFLFLIISISSIFIIPQIGLKYIKPRELIPNEVVLAVKQINPPCLYSDLPYQAVWDLDIPTIYKPVDDSDMFTKGPKECLYFLSFGLSKKSTMNYLTMNGTLLYSHESYQFFKLNNHN